ncbi:hypothetical protein LZC95_50360 [Pendulispora brunnea]|uniref:Apea-like HEPN domain-containing protein n=1 Tax=Pendulispora brunnea TaxID=2905690 RepID=A0ABZ2KBZ5_9BACT
MSKNIAVTISDKRAARATCDKGHGFNVAIAAPAYALLYERALQRLSTGDLRDAVLDAYTALDMYLPNVPLRARYESDKTLTPRDIPGLRSELKKHATRHSERAIGAALAVVSVVSGKAPPHFDRSLSEIRNDAIHAGIYPDREAAEEMIFRIATLILEFESLLNKTFPDRDPSFRLALQIADFPKFEESGDRTTVGTGTILSGDLEPSPTARDRLKQYESGEFPPSSWLI